MTALAHQSQQATTSQNVPDAPDVLVSARGIARGVVGGAIVWAVLLVVAVAS